MGEEVGWRVRTLRDGLYLNVGTEKLQDLGKKFKLEA